MSHPTWGLSRDFRVSTMFYGCSAAPVRPPHPMLRRTLLSAALGSALLAPAADAAEHVPGEVVVRYEGAGRRAPPHRGRPRPRRARACARRSPALRGEPRRAERDEERHRADALVPNDPGRPGTRHGLAADPVELRRPVRRERARRLGQPRGGRPARRARHRRRGARHGRRLRDRGRFLRSPDLARQPLRARLRLRRARPATRTTSTATARTSRRRSPRASTTRSA